MVNPFDQFDEVKSNSSPTVNPFDQFDKKEIEVENDTDVSTTNPFDQFDKKETEVEEPSLLGGLVKSVGEAIEEEFPTLTSIAKAVVSGEEEQPEVDAEGYYDTKDVNVGYFTEPLKTDDSFAKDLYYSVPAIVGSVAKGTGEIAKTVGDLVTTGIDKVFDTDTRTSYIKSLDTVIDYFKKEDESLKIKFPEYRNMMDQFEGERYEMLGKELVRLPATITAYGAAKKGIKKLADNVVPKGKKFKKTKSILKKSVATTGGIGASALADVFQRDPDEMYLANISKDLKEIFEVKPGLMNDTLTILEELKQNPNDTELQQRAKQIKETLLFEGVGATVISALFVPNLLTKAVKSLRKTPEAKEKAILKGITNKTDDGKRTIVDGEEVIKDVSEEGDVVYKKRSKFTEAVGKLNTAAGRLLRSDAALPKQVAEASIKRSAADKAFTLGVKDNIQQLKKIQKKDKVSDESLSNYINNNIDDGLSDGVRLKADQIKKLITTNESKINDMLGLSGENKIGLGFNGGDTYFTRTFEANNNPAYLDMIQKAMEGTLKRNVPKNADFITKVENARTYFRSNGMSKATDEELDGAIMQLVKKLSGEDKGIVSKILDGTEGRAFKGLASQAAKVLKTRKQLDKPILDLLGEQKDPYAKISATLTNQNKLLSEINYLSQVDDFFRKNSDEVVELGGLIPKLPVARTRIKAGSPTTKESADLYNIAEEALGKFGGGTKLLKDLHVSPQMYNYVRNGLDIFNPRDQVGGAFTRSLSQISAYGQSTQTILDLPAYAINTYGALQALAANGLIFSPAAYKGAKIATSNFAKQLSAFRKNDTTTKKAIERLERLKSSGVIDTDLTSEMITKNINVYGKQIGSKFGKIGQAYSKAMEKASTAYGAPDTYSKLVGFEGEFAVLGKVFPRIKSETLKQYDDRIFDMAAERIRNTMPSYSVAAPLARSLSRLPIGTYALFPSEMVRTTKNILTYAVKDIKDGVRNGNKKQVAMGLRRLTGLGVTATGVDYVLRDNNQQVGVTDKTNRVMSVLSPEWGKNSKRYHTQGLIEGPDGRILTRFINSSSIDAQDYLKVPIRAIIGKLTAGQDVSEFEIKEVMDGMRKAIVGPYTNPKFVTEALINLFQKDFYSDVPEEEGLSIENSERVFGELQKSLQPGTMQVILKNLEARRSEEKRGRGEGRNEYGFPQTAKDQFTWLTTGIRPVTMDIKKSMGFNLSNDIKAIKSTKDAFIKRLGKIGKDAPFTEDIRKEIIAEYDDLQGKKFRAMQKLADKASLFADLEYQNKNNNTIQFGLSTVLDAATSGFNYGVPDEIIYAQTIRNGLGKLEGGIFMPDDLSNDKRLFKLIENKSWTNTLIGDLVEAQSKYYGRKLKE
tara:strand:+ start:505 stop:4611 length:4107 start_codon:yes stop_codon:yes gene_type:complete